MWRLFPDGRLTGVFTGLRNTIIGPIFVEDTDTGRWWIREASNGAGQFCAQWRRWYRGQALCYAVRPSNGKWHAFAPAAYGPAFRATVDSFNP